MASNRFTTELLENQITICIIDSIGQYSSYLAEFFEKKGLQVTVIDPSVVQEKTDILEQAYKIVVCLSPVAYTTVTEAVLQAMIAYQSKVNLVMPVVSGCELQVAGEIPYLYEWIESQRRLITYCNDILPQATFVFGQDVLVPPGMGSVFDILCQHIQTGFVFGPSVSFTPQTLPSFCEAAVGEILQPYRSSVSIAGRMKYTTKLMQKVAQLYEGYYFSDIAVQPVSAYETETLPFRAKNVLVAEDEETLIAWYTRELPSPEQEPFFEPTKFDLVVPAEESAEVEQELSPPSYLYEQSPVQDFLGETELSEELTAAESPQNSAESEKYAWQDSPQVSPPIERERDFSNRETDGQTDPASSTEKTDFVPAPTPSIDSPSLEQLKRISPDFNVSSEIQRIFTSSRQEKVLQRADTLVKAQTRIQKKSKKRTSLFYGGLAFTGLGLGVLVLMAVFLSSFHFLKKSLFTVLQKTAANEEVLESEWSRLQRFTQLVNAQTTGFTAVVSLPQLEEAQHAVAVNKNLKELAASTAAKNESLQKLVLVVLGGETGNIEELAQNVGAQSLKTHENLSSIENDISQISFADSAAIDTVTQSYQKQMDQLKKQASLHQQMQHTIGSLFGVSQRRTYAVIFQNNQELRPTGGFLEAVALLTFENGTLINHDLYTSYELHKKMPGEVVAPAEITRATGEKVYFFHDSNWNPDFPKSADQIKWFLEKAVNTQIHGVMAVDLEGIQNILEATGPLDIPEYNEVITHKNLFERMEFHSEVILLESAKNQDYRKLLFSRLLDRVLTIKGEKVVALMSALENSFMSQSVLLSLAEPEEHQVFQGLGWTGAQVVPRCPGALSEVSCLLDPFMQVEANVGANKANYYLKRTIDHTIAVSPTAAVHNRVISFENTAQLNAWPKGAYKSYIRFYLPNNALTPSIKVDGQVVAASEITKVLENGQQVLGFLVEVPIKSKRQVALQYTLPFSFAAKSDFSYVFFNQEQPGNGDTPFILRVVPDSTLRPELIAPQASVAADGIVFSSDDDNTGIYGVQFNQAN